MHACLDVDEIVRLITHELVAPETKSAAVALACCCKSFEGPVLDVLWETQQELVPLLRSLPGDVWSTGRCTVSVPTTHFFFPSLNSLVRKAFKRLPTTLEWARFRKYARRMRTLGGLGVLNVLSSEVFSILQLSAIDEPLFPNIKTLELWPARDSISYIPLFLSPRTTTITIGLSSSDFPTAMVASMITNFPKLCPDLQNVNLYLSDDPIITAAVSAMLLASNRNALRRFRVRSPLTEEAREVVYTLPNLCTLWAVINRDTPLPLVVLPNLTNLTITYEHDNDWLRLFHGATLGPLEAITFHSESEQIGDFLEAFERVALAASVQNTLSTFRLRTPCSWNPNYPSLHQFTQMTDLVIEFSCDDGCSSTVDDDVIMNLARSMPKLKNLELGDPPCHEIPIGVTAKGLVVLAHHCPDLFSLCIHFQVSSLTAPPTVPGMAPTAGSAVPRRSCALRHLEVGEIPVPEESVLMVALTLAQIFPHIVGIGCGDGNWFKVVDAIRLSRRIIDCSSKEHPLSAPRSNFSDASLGAVLSDGN